MIEWCIAVASCIVGVGLLIVGILMIKFGLEGLGYLEKGKDDG